MLYAYYISKLEKIYYLLTGKTVEMTDKIGKQYIS